MKFSRFFYDFSQIDIFFCQQTLLDNIKFYDNLTGPIWLATLSRILTLLYENWKCYGC
jgi:hypothetical protein